MATKYDTNPLDPEFPEKARAAAAKGQATQTLPYADARTQAFPYVAPTEEQTRRFVEPDVQAYSAPYAEPYNGQYVPAAYQQATMAEMNRSSSRKVAKIGLPENIMTAAPYIPWYPGLVAAIIMLFVLPRSESKVRFHAAQGLAAHVAIWIIAAVIGGFSGVTGVANVAGIMFSVATTITLIVFAVKAWQGKPVHIGPIDELTNWLEEKISPKN